MANCVPRVSAKCIGAGGGSIPETFFIAASASTVIATAAARAMCGGGKHVLADQTHTCAHEENLATKMEDVAEMIGHIADKVLMFVSDRMPGLEAWTISTLDTIFAPRLVLR